MKDKNLEIETILYVDEKISYVSGTTNNYSMIYDTIPQRIQLMAQLHPNHVAFAFPHNDGLELTYTEVKERVTRVAKSLLALGFKRGDKLAFVLPNTHELMITFFAAASLGVISVLLDPVYREHEVEYFLNKTQANGVIVIDQFDGVSYSDMIKRIFSSNKVPSLRHVILLHKFSENIVEKFSDNFWYYDELSKAQFTDDEHQLPDDISPDDPVAIIFTSGSTGPRKGAVMSTFNYFNSGAVFMRSQGDPNWMERFCTCGQMFHTSGVLCGTLCPLIQKMLVVFPYYNSNEGVEESAQAIEKYKCTAMFSMPKNLFHLVNGKYAEKYDLSSLKYALTGGQLVAREFSQRALDTLKLNAVVIIFGMTEIGITHMYNYTADSNSEPETIGRPLAFIECRVVEPSTGKTLPHNETGELWVRGVGVTRQYWDEPEKTRDALTEYGWFRTGDIVRMNKDGYFSYVNRLKEVLIKGGKKIYPFEIESFLRKHPDVLNVCVFGIPIDHFDEEVCVWIILKAESTLTTEDIIKFCDNKLSKSKIPKYIKFVKDFPISTTYKVDKNVIAKKFRQELNL